MKKNENLYYIPHWNNEGSLFLNKDNILKFSMKFKNKWILPHQYMFKDKERCNEAMVHINFLIANGFRISNTSIGESLKHQGVFLIDIFSSTCAEAIYLDKDVYYIDSKINDDNFVKYLRNIGQDYQGNDGYKPIEEIDKEKLSFSLSNKKHFLSEAIKQL